MARRTLALLACAALCVLAAVNPSSGARVGRSNDGKAGESPLSYFMSHQATGTPPHGDDPVHERLGGKHIYPKRRLPGDGKFAHALVDNEGLYLPPETARGAAVRPGWSTAVLDGQAFNYWQEDDSEAALRKIPAKTLAAHVAESSFEAGLFDEMKAAQHASVLPHQPCFDCRAMIKAVATKALDTESGGKSGSGGRRYARGPWTQSRVVEAVQVWCGQHRNTARALGVACDMYSAVEKWLMAGGFVADGAADAQAKVDMNAFVSKPDAFCAHESVRLCGADSPSKPPETGVGGADTALVRFALTFDVGELPKGSSFHQWPDLVSAMLHTMADALGVARARLQLHVHRYMHRVVEVVIRDAGDLQPWELLSDDFVSKHAANAADGHDHPMGSMAAATKLQGLIEHGGLPLSFINMDEDVEVFRIAPRDSPGFGNGFAATNSVSRAAHGHTE